MNDNKNQERLRELGLAIQELLSSSPMRGGIETDSTTYAPQPVSTATMTNPMAASSGNVAMGASGTAGTIARTFSAIAAPAIPLRKPENSVSGWLRWINPIAGLLGLFGGGGEPAEPVSYTAPTRKAEPVFFRQGIQSSNGWRSADVDWGADGQVRPIQATPSPTSIVVQVQAIDSRSFLDHSDAIADAVKKSLSESHGLTDALREL